MREHLLTADQPPQSPERWELWWLQVTRRAIAASYLVYHGRPGPGGGDPTRLVHASCYRGFAPAPAGRTRYSQTARPRGLLEPRAAMSGTHGSEGIGGATRRSYPQTAGRCGSRPWSTPRTICAATAASRIWTSCKPRHVTSTPGCSILSESGRVVSLRAQPLSGSRSPRSPPGAGGLQPCVSATLGSWPCSAPCASASTPSGSPAGAFAPR